MNISIYGTREYRELECRYDGPIPAEEIARIEAIYRRQPTELERAEAMAKQAFEDVAAAKERMGAAMSTGATEAALDDLCSAEIVLRHWTERVALLRAEAASIQSMAPVFVGMVRRAGE